MKRSRNVLAFVLLCALVVIVAASGLFTSCTRKNDKENGTGGGATQLYERDNSFAYDYSGAQSVVPASPPKAEASYGTGTEYTERETKRIKTGRIDTESTDFDGLNTWVAETAQLLGGYIESSSLYRAGDGLRRLSLTLRVPSECFDYIMQAVADRSSVTSSSASETDATEQYYDTAARLSAKESEEQRLLELIEQATELSDLILLEQRLSTVRSDIEIYKSRMTYIDRASDYSVIYLFVVEKVDIYSPETLWQKLGKAFGDSIDGMVAFLQSALVTLVAAAIPVLVIIVMAFIGWRVFRALMRRRHKPKKKSADDDALKAVKILVDDAKHDEREQ